MKGGPLTIYLSHEMRKRLEEFCKERGYTASRVIQEALDEYLSYEVRKKKMREFLDDWSGTNDEGLIESWNIYQETERKEERAFDASGA